MRKAYWLLGGVLVLGALGWGALRLRPSVALTGATLPDLMDACAEAALQKSADPVAGHWMVKVEAGFRAARLTTEAGPVTLLAEYRHDTGELYACRITGDVWADEASVRDPGVTWAAAQAVVADWFARRLQQPGHRSLQLNGPFSAVYCPGDGREGFFLDAGPGEYGSLSTGIADADRPVFIRFAHSANDPAQACQIVTQGG